MADFNNYWLNGQVDTLLDSSTTPPSGQPNFRQECQQTEVMAVTELQSRQHFHRCCH
jgi:hypothetical protein